MVDTSWLFGSTPPNTFLSPTTATTTLPAWFQDAQKALISKASGIANEPYTPYGGPRVAGLDPLQQQAITDAGTVGDSGQNTLQSGANLASNAGWTQFDPNQFQKFMSPYTDGVVNRIADLGQRNLTENLLPSINSSFIGSGMPFGSRHEDITARALRDTNESIMGQQSQALQQSYDSAMTNYQGALQRQAQTGGILAGIGTGQTQNQLQAGGYQQLMGSIPQQLGQQNLDMAYQDFQNQKNYPLQQLDTVNSILQGYSPYQSKSATAYTGTALPASSTQNAGTAALSALGSFFNSK